MKNRRQQQARYRAERSAAFKAAGLRCDGKLLAPRKPCGCRTGSCLQCGGRKTWPPTLVQAVWADYQAGLSLTALGRKYDKHRKSLSAALRRRGFNLREFARPKLGPGVRIPEPTEAELAAMIAGLKHLAVPRELKQVWKRWDYPQRQAFIAKLRVKFPSTQPTGPFSKGMKPFQYGDPAAMALAAKLNRGRNSQTKRAAIKPGSEGIIYAGKLWFWSQSPKHGATGYVTGNHPRPALHRVLWTQYHGRPVPNKMTVIHADGNKNNFSRANLVLRTREDCARANQVFLRLARDPHNEVLQAKALMVAEALVAGKVSKSRRKTALLLAAFNGGANPLLTQLKGAR